MTLSMFELNRNKIEGNVIDRKEYRETLAEMRKEKHSKSTKSNYTCICNKCNVDEALENNRNEDYVGRNKK